MKKIMLFFLLLMTNVLCSQNTNISECEKLNEKAMKIYSVNPEKALTLLKIAEQKAKFLADNNLIGLCLSNIAILQRLKGDFQYSKELSLKALSLSKNNRTIAAINNNLGVCSRGLGLYNQSLKYYFLALKYYERKGDIKKEATTNNNIGLVFSAVSEFNKAKEYHNKSLKLFNQINDSKGFSETYNNLAIVLANQDSLKKALVLFKKSLKIEEKLNDKKGIAESLCNVGSIYNMLMVNDSSIYYLRKSAKMDLLYGNKPSAYDTYNNIANALIESNKFEDAKSLIDSTFKFSIESKNKNIELNAYLLYGNFYEKKKIFSNSNIFLKKHYILKDSIRNNTNLSDLNNLDAKYQTSKKEQIIQKQKAEAKQHNQNLIIVSLLGVLGLVTGFFFYKNQKTKNHQQKQESALKEALLKIEAENQLQEQRLGISKELHDNIGSQLTFVISSIDTLKQNYPSTNENIDSQLENINAFTKNTIDELRDTVWVMNSKEIDSNLLKERLLENLNRAKMTYPNIDFKVNISHFNIDNSLVALNLFRALQEAINNALKYANANEIEIEIAENNNQIEAFVNDNGKGFEINKQIASKLANSGNGLRNMKKRIQSINGKFNLTSSENLGTRVEIVISKKNLI